MLAGKNSVWTEGATTQLRRLWLTRISASKIAKQLGGPITRNAVIAKLYRLGLKLPKDERLRAQTKKGAAPKKPPPPRAHPTVATPPYTPPHRPHHGPLVDLVDLKACQCRWPVGDPKEPAFGFCGRTTNQRYCAEHTQWSTREVAPALTLKTLDPRGRHGVNVRTKSVA